MWSAKNYSIKKYDSIVSVVLGYPSTQTIHKGILIILLCALMPY